MATEIVTFTLDDEAGTVVSTGSLNGQALPPVTSTGDDASRLRDLLEQMTIIVAVDELEQEGEGA